MFKYARLGLFCVLFASGALFGAPSLTQEDIAAKSTDELVAIIKQHNLVADPERCVLFGREFVNRDQSDIWLRIIVQRLGEAPWGMDDQVRKWWVEQLIDTLRNNERLVSDEVLTAYMVETVLYATCRAQEARDMLQDNIALLGNENVYCAFDSMYWCNKDEWCLYHPDYSSDGEERVRWYMPPLDVFTGMDRVEPVKCAIDYIRNYTWYSDEWRMRYLGELFNDIMATDTGLSISIYAQKGVWRVSFASEERMKTRSGSTYPLSEDKIQELREVVDHEFTALLKQLSAEGKNEALLLLYKEMRVDQLSADQRTRCPLVIDAVNTIPDLPNIFSNPSQKDKDKEFLSTKTLLLTGAVVVGATAVCVYLWKKWYGNKKKNKANKLTLDRGKHV